ncbi:MAG: hypothetical protein ACUVRY_01120 [Thermoanaerobaculaceae bacterium]
MDEASVRLEEAHQSLVLARNEVHTVNPERVRLYTGEAQKALKEAEKKAEEAKKELRFRHNGLKVALFVILLALLALALKIRQIETKS